MLATPTEILQYIPQRNPIVMVHELLEASDTHAVTRFSIKPDNVFVSSGTFAEPGLVENIAQTAAVHVGYQCSQKKYSHPNRLYRCRKRLKDSRFTKPKFNRPYYSKSD